MQVLHITKIVKTEQKSIDKKTFHLPYNIYLEVIALSKREQFVTLKTFDLASFWNTIGVDKTEEGLQLRAGEVSNRSICSFEIRNAL